MPSAGRRGLCPAYTGANNSRASCTLLSSRQTLKALSSSVMIRLGRVHQGLMVDVQAINATLLRRSEHMLLRLTGRDPRDVRAALEQASSIVKLAGCRFVPAVCRTPRARSSAPAGGCRRR
jgi:N-acetylmuramic acid 6-phosphate (MurNAc-6-P) etherase